MQVFELLLLSIIYVGVVSCYGVMVMLVLVLMLVVLLLVVFVVEVMTVIVGVVVVIVFEGFLMICHSSM